MKRTTVFGLTAGVLLAGWLLHSRTKPVAAPPAPEAANPDKQAEGRAFRPRLPAPRMRATAQPDEPLPESSRPTNLLARLLKGGDDFPTLRLEQVGPYLEANRRSAESLLAASRATGD